MLTIVFSSPLIFLPILGVYVKVVVGHMLALSINLDLNFMVGSMIVPNMEVKDEFLDTALSMAASG